MRKRRWLVAVLFAATATAACSRGFNVARFPTPVELYAASMAEFEKGKWDRAITGFERLTLDLAARDTLLPRAHWYLAEAHTRRKEFLIAATGFSRVSESFPDDTLADDALFQSGESYLKLWRSPELDPQYGTLAQLQFRQLLGIYPDSPLAVEADQRMVTIDDLFASKDYRNGQFYVRRRAFDSAIIYFKDVVKDYPNTNHARMALLRMVEVYRRPQMNYKEEAAETCATLRAAYAGDPEVLLLCPVAADSATSPETPPLSVDAERNLRPASR
ncbi:MAG: outer membrane protein assembly factor BamD [Gemmatimonadetes bacterium]|nr:outer membrane protein assembly factor BamD [Gemmatimonadota bacterium]